ncbi:MAG: tellurite resistance TerB family protein [Saccharospirillum sp.]
MFTKILAWFDAPTEADEPELSADEAATALMVEVMLSDYQPDKREESLILERLAARTESSLEQVRTLLDSARQHHDESHDLFEFTRVINQHWGESQKYDLMVDLWRTALADGTIDKHEDHIIRRINGLLHMHHSHFIKAKHQAQEGE